MAAADRGPLILLMPTAFGEELRPLARNLGFGEPVCVNSSGDLLAAVETTNPRVLLSFSTGVIVPSTLLARPGLVAANVHGAPPSFPGRDPHHWAVYEGAADYGATLHYMACAVDQGPVIAATREPIPASATPADLMAIGVRHGLELARRFLRELATSGAPPVDPRLAWSGRVRRRSEFLALCRIEPGISPEELERRVRATAMPGYANLVLELHGHRFRLEQP